MNYRKLILLITIGVIAFASIPAWEVWRGAQDTAVGSCAASLHRSINELEGLGSIITEVGSEWRVLTEDESVRLMLAASRSGSMDCGEREPSGLPLDEWGNRFKVAFRRSTRGDRLEFRIWSDGRDGISRTSDDIVSPYDVQVPASN